MSFWSTLTLGSSRSVENYPLCPCEMDIGSLVCLIANGFELWEGFLIKRPVQKCLEGERHPHQKPPQSLLRCWRLYLTDSLPARSLRARWQASSEPLLAAWHPKDFLLLCTFDHLPPVLHRINFGRYLQTQITYIKHRKKKKKKQASIKG